MLNCVSHIGQYVTSASGCHRGSTKLREPVECALPGVDGVGVAPPREVALPCTLEALVAPSRVSTVSSSITTGLFSVMPRPGSGLGRLGGLSARTTGFPAVPDAAPKGCEVACGLGICGLDAAAGAGAGAGNSGCALVTSSLGLLPMGRISSWLVLLLEAITSLSRSLPLS